MDKGEKRIASLTPLQKNGIIIKEVRARNRAEEAKFGKEEPMKRLLAFLLTLVLLTSLFAGCKKKKDDGEETVPTEPVEKILITYEKEPHERLLALAKDLETILTAAGYQTELAEDNGTAAAADAYEIYLGSVERDLVSSLESEIGDCGYGVKLEGNKLCLAGSCADFVRYAYESLPNDLFTNRAIPFAGVENSIKQFGDFLELYQNGAPNMHFTASSESEDLMTLLGDFKTKIANHLRTKVDNLKGGSINIEIRELTQSEGFEFGTYSITTTGNRIVIAGTGLEDLKIALDAFYSSVVNISNYRSTGVFHYPANVTLGASVDVQVPSLPYDSTAKLYTANADGSYVLTWEEKKIDVMDSYAEKLAAYGYKLEDTRTTSYQYVKTDINYDDNNPTYTNTFRTYTNGIYRVYAYYSEGTGAVRVVATSLAENRALANLRAETAAEAKVEPSFTLLNIGGESKDGKDFMVMSGMCFAFQLSDGRFIMVDGGEWRDGDTNASDVIRLYEWLKEKVPDGKITIAAWILTHHHSDHINVAWKFEQMYGKEVTIQRYMYSFPTMDYAATAPDSDVNVPYYDRVFPRTMSMLSRYECVVPRTGMVYEIGDATLEVMYTHDDFYPNPLKDFNNSSIAYRITLGGKSFLIAGDLEEPGQMIASHMNGTLLESDYVQSTHHSYNGLKLFFRYGLGSSGEGSAIWPLNHGVRWPKVEQDGIEYNNTYLRTLEANNWLYENSKEDYFAYHGIQTIPLG